MQGLIHCYQELNEHKANMKTKEAAQVTIKEGANITEVDPIANLLDPDLIGSAIMQCLIENDPKGVMEIIEDHLYALNKSKFLKKSGYTKIDNVSVIKKKKSND